MKLWQLFLSGGFTMYVLLGFSFISIGIIIERSLYYRSRSKIRRKDFMASIREALEQKDFKKAMAVCDKSNAPFAGVVCAGIKVSGRGEKEIAGAMEREIVIETSLLEKLTSVVGTIGGVAVYIGLFGTVVGIIRAFRDIAKANSGGLSVVINGISEALICTAAGLCVAVPAVIAYNYFVKRIDGFIMDMELCASETKDLLERK